jgi:hypothetical protein
LSKSCGQPAGLIDLLTAVRGLSTGRFSTGGSDTALGRLWFGALEFAAGALVVAGSDSRWAPFGLLGTSRRLADAL